MHNAFPLDELVERPMSRAIVLTGAAVLLTVLAQRGRRNRSGGMHSKDRASLQQGPCVFQAVRTGNQQSESRYKERRQLGSSSRRRARNAESCLRYISRTWCLRAASRRSTSVGVALSVRRGRPRCRATWGRDRLFRLVLIHFLASSRAQAKPSSAELLRRNYVCYVRG
jgi:hypothetical protein